MGHSESPVSLSSSQGSSPQAPVWSFPIVHLFRPPFEVEIHGCKVHLVLIVRGEPSRKVRLHRPTIQGYGRPWRKDEELDTVFLARTLKLPIEFTSSSTSWPAPERALPEEFLEEHPGEVGRGLRMEGRIGPPGDKISGSELLIHLSRKGTIPEVSMAMRSPGDTTL